MGSCRWRCRCEGCMTEWEGKGWRAWSLPPLPRPLSCGTFVLHSLQPHVFFCRSSEFYEREIRVLTQPLFCPHPTHDQILTAEREIKVLTDCIHKHQEQQQEQEAQRQAGRRQHGPATWPRLAPWQQALAGGGQPAPLLAPLALPVVRWASRRLKGKATVMRPHEFEYRVSQLCPALCVVGWPEPFLGDLMCPPHTPITHIATTQQHAHHAPQVLGKGSILRYQLPLMLAWALTIQ